MENEELISTIQEVTNNYTDILSLEQAIEYNLFERGGNGSGDRQKICRLFYVTKIYKDSRLPRTYPVELDLEEYEERINDYKQSRSEIRERGTIGFIIHCENNDNIINHPIRPDIKAHYRILSCVICNNSKTVCDHKNDLYNDIRVLNMKTQVLEDFQPLCNSCNLRKRSVMIKTKSENKRQLPPPQIYNNFTIDFTEGNESFDPKDSNTLVGSYWYDPVQFIRDCINL